jgi:non-ribosomal peptide synthetase component F
MIDIADRLLVHEMIAAQAARTPDAVAVLADGEAWTYGHLVDCASQIARVLRETGAGRETVVGLAYPRSFAGVAGMLGIWSAAAAFVYLDPALPPARLAHIVAECRMPVILTADATAVARLGAAVVELTDVLAAGWGGPPPPAGNTPGDLCYVVYTSGSTGVPKGVAVEHAGVANMARQLARIFGVAEGMRMLQYSAWSWDAALCELLVALTTGATMVVAPDQVRGGGQDLAGFLREQRIEVATLVPSVLAALPEDNLPDLRTMVAVGEPCPPEVVDRWGRGRRFLNGYGPTEATVAVSVG